METRRLFLARPIPDKMLRNSKICREHSSSSHTESHIFYEYVSVLINEIVYT